MVVAAKTKKLEIGKATSSILKGTLGGKVLSSTDLYGNGFHLKVA